MSMFTHGEMPFLDHLEELRWRLFKIVLALAVGVILTFTVLVLGKIDVILFLAQPVLPYLKDGTLMTTGPSDNFKIVLSASVGVGAVLASPVIVWQLWGFFSPAMYKHEKRVVIPVLVGAALLFLAGLALAYYVALPPTLKFLLTSFTSEAIKPQMTTDKYFSFLFGMAFAFGIAFELPIVILLLTALGLVTPTMLTRFRRHAFVACIVGAAIITPGSDPTSLVILTVPLYMLYEVSIVLSHWVYKGRLKREARQAAMDALG